MHKMIYILVLITILASSSVSAQMISNGDISVYVTIKNQLLKVTLSGPGMKDFATGYLWQAVIDGEKITALSNPKVLKSGKNSLIISGMLGPINVEQRLTLLPDGDGVSEAISLQNPTEKVIALDDIHTGFSRTVDPKSDPWRLIAVPYRVQADGRIHDYKISDIARITGDSKQEINSNKRDTLKNFGNHLCDEDYRRFRSEGWIFDNGNQGMVVIKYNNHDIEYSVVNLEGSRLSFGGAAFTLFNEPGRAKALPPGKTFIFGENHYKFYTGQWQNGFDLFKNFMNAHGHGIGHDYSPFVHWNVLYNLGMGDGTDWKKKNWTLDHLFKEAALAKEVGCGRLYLDPGWETAWGANIWDEVRLGSLKDFVEIIKEKYGMDVALWSPGQWSTNVWPVEWNIKQRDIKQTEKIAKKGPQPNDFGLCMASEQWRQARLERMLSLARSGVKWFMFDFHGYMENWPFPRRPCYAKNHGHEAPSTTADHIDAIYGITSEIRRQFPDIQIESHDPIWAWGVRYTPTYFRQGFKNGDYDENWANEFMWNTLEDLKSGKAMCLYYYNLAYDIPLYLHIPINKDNRKCLAFWWMASTVRHLGIGGTKAGTDTQTGATDESQKLFAAYKEAMVTYNRLKPYFTSGEFIGLDETAHLHTLPEKPGGVLMMFNLGGEAIKRIIHVPLDKLKLKSNAILTIKGANGRIEGDDIILELDLEPETPVVVEICIG